MTSIPRCFAVLVATTLLSGNLSAQEFNFTDVTGQEIKLEAPPRRIITLPNPAAATFIAIDGSTELLVGMNEGSKRAFECGMMSVMFPEAVDISSDILSENGGWMPNVEAIAELKPDLVIQWGERGDDIVAPLRNAGLPVALMVGGGNAGTEELARANMKMVADITGNTEKLSKLIDWRDRVQSEITTGLKQVGFHATPSILHLRSAKSKLIATGEKSYQQTFIELVGAKNVAQGAGVQSTVSVEQILEWNPDIILLSAAETDAGLEAIYDDPLLSRLNAAVQKRVYKIPQGGYIWDSASHESPYTWMWLANLTHPDIFSFDLRHELKEGFKLLYNFDLSDEQIDRILRIAMNGDSHGYQVFRKQ